MNDIELLEDDVISCYAGLTLKELTDFCIENSLTNLEFSCGIPGSVGGAIFMNAGAYGGEMKEVVQKDLDQMTKTGKEYYGNTVSLKTKVFKQLLKVTDGFSENLFK